MLELIGGVLVVASAVLVFDIAGAGRGVIRHLTSKPLGSLAPGYAASWTGFRVYALMLAAIGGVVGGVGVAETLPVLGVIYIAVGLVGFIALSVLAVRGEMRTYRALKH